MTTSKASSASAEPSVTPECAPSSLIHRSFTTEVLTLKLFTTMFFVGSYSGWNSTESTTLSVGKIGSKSSREFKLLISSLPATILTESFARGFEITLKSVKSSAEVLGSVGERLMKALGVVGMFLDWLEVVGGRLVVDRVVERGKDVVGGFGRAVEGGEVEVEVVVVVEGVQLPET